MFVYIYIYMYVCMYVYMYVCIYIYIELFSSYMHRQESLKEPAAGHGTPITLRDPRASDQVYKVGLGFRALGFRV